MFYIRTINLQQLFQHRLLLSKRIIILLSIKKIYVVKLVIFTKLKTVRLKMHILFLKIIFYVTLALKNKTTL